MRGCWRRRGGVDANGGGAKQALRRRVHLCAGTRNQQTNVPFHPHPLNETKQAPRRHPRRPPPLPRVRVPRPRPQAPDGRDARLWARRAPRQGAARAGRRVLGALQTATRGGGRLAAVLRNSVARSSIATIALTLVLVPPNPTTTTNQHSSTCGRCSPASTTATRAGEPPHTHALRTASVLYVLSFYARVHSDCSQVLFLLTHNQ